MNARLHGETCAELHIDPLVEALQEFDFDDRDDLNDFAIEFLEEDCLGFTIHEHRRINGVTYFNVLEFTMNDASTIALAEDEEGDLSFLTSPGSPSRYRH